MVGIESNPVEAFCGQCGAKVTAAFCTRCGAKRPEVTVGDSASGWSGVASELIGKERAGALAAAMDMLRTPIETTIRLTADPRYDGHLKFMSAGLAVNLTVLLVITPKVVALLGGTPTPYKGVMSSTSWAAATFGLAIMFMTFIQYYWFKAFSPAQRTPRSYYKLCMISVGYLSFLASAIRIVYLAIIAVLLPASESFYRYADMTEGVLVLVLTMLYVIGHQRRFWEIGRVRSTILCIAALVATIAVQSTLLHVASALKETGMFD